MSRRTMLTLSTATGLCVLYSVYAQFVRPQIDPTVEIGRPALSPPPAPPRPATSVALAKTHLDPWAANAKYHLHAENAYVYAEELATVNANKAVRFEPFAMIWQQHGKQADEAPITIAADSAVVQFASKFSITSPNMGRVVGGALQKKVHIRGPNGLSIVGWNFFFDEAAMLISSAYPVSFAYGPHRGRAGAVQIELVPAPEPRKQNQLSVTGIRSVRLRKKVDMDLVSEEHNRPIHVKVRSDSFEYTIETNVAIFKDDVQVHRPTDGSHFDILKCELLTLVFEPKGPQEQTVAAADDREFSELDAGLTFRRLRAEGDRVVLVSEANELTVRMTELTYDDQANVAVLIDPQGVDVAHGASRLRCPEISLIRGDDGKIASAWCRGAGWLRHHDRETGKLQFAAQWAKQLRKYPDQTTGLDVIELEKHVIVHQPERKVGLAAEFLRLWIDRPKTSRKILDAGTTGKSSERIRPRRLLAMNNVAIDSPDLRVRKTNRLDVWFEDGSTGRASDQTVERSAAQALRPSDPRAIRLSGGQAARRLPESLTARKSDSPKARKPVKDDGPLELVSDRIRVRMLQSGERDEAEVAEIWTQGNVHVQQQHESGQQPLGLTGDRLHLQNRSEHDQVLHVFGEPAHIRDRGRHIEGREIHLDRAANLAWVTGAGLLELPVTRSLEGEQLDEPRALDVWWDEQMRFDGSSANFYGNVRAVLGDGRMRCQQMQVLFHSVADSEQPRRDVEVERVICKDGVQFDSYEYEANKLIGVRRAHFWEFSMNQVTGHTEAQGPGWITIWRRGRGKRASLSPLAIVQANRPLKPHSADWEYTRIDFVGKTLGNLKQRHTMFHDRVQIVYGPVERPPVTIDPDNLPKDAGWMRCDSLQLTQHEETQTDPAYIELLAGGNAELEGRSFHARADSISYDESKRLYMLRSLGNRKATIWRQLAPGGELSRADAQSMQFVPSNNRLKRLKLDRTTGLEGLQ